VLTDAVYCPRPKPEPLKTRRREVDDRAIVGGRPHVAHELGERGLVEHEEREEVIDAPHPGEVRSWFTRGSVMWVFRRW